MKATLKWTALVVGAAVIGLALAVGFAAVARAQAPGGVVQAALAQATPTPNGSWWGYGHGGGFGRGGWGSGYGSGWGMGPGMTPALAPGASVGGYGGRGMMGPGTMGGYGGWGYGYYATPQGTPVPVDGEIDLTATDYRFDPPAIAVEAGETVRLVVSNRDGVPHNLYGYGPGLPIAFTPLPAGATRSVTFTAPEVPRSYSAICTFHPGMSLEVVVK